MELEFVDDKLEFVGCAKLGLLVELVDGNVDDVDGFELVEFVDDKLEFVGCVKLGLLVELVADKLELGPGVVLILV